MASPGARQASPPSARARGGKLRSSLCTKAPGTTGNSVNEVTRRRLNMGKITEDLSPLGFSDWIEIQQLVKTKKDLRSVCNVLISVI